MLWSLLTLIVITAMVLTMRHPPGEAPNRRPTTRPVSRASKLGRTTGSSPASSGRPVAEGKVSYRLMNEHLPTRSQRMWRSVHRFLKGPRGERTDGAERHGIDTGASGRQPAGPQHSAELQNFLDARRRSVTRHNDNDTKRGPDDTLH